MSFPLGVPMGFKRYKLSQQCSATLGKETGGHSWLVFKSMVFHGAALLRWHHSVQSSYHSRWWSIMTGKADWGLDLFSTVNKCIMICSGRSWRQTASDWKQGPTYLMWNTANGWGQLASVVMNALLWKASRQDWMFFPPVTDAIAQRQANLGKSCA